MTVDEIKEKITPTLKQHRVQYAGVFGSVAREQSRVNSDIDILVKFQDAPTFSAYLNLDETLAQLLGGKVDLVTEGGLNKFLRPSVEKDLKMIYGQR